MASPQVIAPQPRQIGPERASVAGEPGAWGDLGTFIPHVIGAMTVAGLAPAGVLFRFSGFLIATGLFYGLPLPVQPMKAISAVILTGGLRPADAAAAGIMIGVVLLVLGVTSWIGRLARAIPQSVSAGLQLGLGLLLAVLGLKLILQTPWLGFGSLALLFGLTRIPHCPAAPITLAVAMLAGWATGHVGFASTAVITPALPHLVVPNWVRLDVRSDFWKSRGCHTYEIPGFVPNSTARHWRASVFLPSRTRVTTHANQFSSGTDLRPNPKPIPNSNEFRSMPLTEGKGKTKHDISIVGLGIVKVDQITIEAERAICQSNEVLYIETGIGVRAFLMERCNNVTDLTSSYIHGRDRLETYHFMAASVIESALDHAPIAFALYGHPTIFAYPPFLIYEMACKLNLSVKIFPGISAMDCIFAELMIDPGTDGMQMYEATDLLLRRRPLQADASALIWQVGALETAMHSNNPSRPDRLRRFKAHLLHFYPAKHEIYAVYCSSYSLMGSIVYRFALDEIDHYADKMHSGFTLYIPPAYNRSIQDQELARDIFDFTHLERITRA